MFEDKIPGNKPNMAVPENKGYKQNDVMLK